MLTLCPISLEMANTFIRKHHRHHGAVVGCKFVIAVSDGKRVVGVAIVGRPISRYLDDGWTLEVTRCCTDGTRNACSKLYSACWKATQSIGYKRLITYILSSEHGTSLLASGWTPVGKRGGGSWSRRARPRKDDHPLQTKFLFEKNNGKPLLDLEQVVMELPQQELLFLE